MINERDRDAFIRSYFSTAIWASSDDEGHSYEDKNYDDTDILPESAAKMEADCDDFLKNNEADIGEDFEQAGSDFWLTRNRHGAGFWDGHWPEEAAKRLTAHAHDFGECYLWEDKDGNLYLSS